MIGESGSRIRELVFALLQNIPKGRLLEAAAGGGYLASELSNRGFEVTGADLVNQWRFSEIPFVVADLDQPLPFEDRSFDVIIFSEGLGYIENVQSVLREFHRILKPGGHVVITMPNVFSFQSRLKFLFNGSFRWFPHLPQIQGDKAALADVYRDPTRVTTLHFYLKRTGFSLLKTEFGGGRSLSALAPLGLALQAFTFIENIFRKKKKTPLMVNSFPALLFTNVGILASAMTEEATPTKDSESMTGEGIA